MAQPKAKLEVVRQTSTLFDVRNAIATVGLKNATLESVSAKMRVSADDLQDDIMAECGQGFEDFVSGLRLICAFRTSGDGEITDSLAGIVGFKDAAEAEAFCVRKTGGSFGEIYTWYRNSHESDIPELNAEL